MSSKGRAATDYKADPNGFFETQATVTRAGMTTWGIQPGMRILQPGCGTGAIAKVLRRQFGNAIEIVGLEIDKGRAKKAANAKVAVCRSIAQLPVYNEVVVGSCFDYKPEGKFDWAIENPSFGIWLKVAEYCFEHAERTSLLIPWNSAASMGRAAWWGDHPAYCRVLSKRPSFAISVKCVHSNGKWADRDGVKLCTYQELIPLSVKPKKTCPVCGESTYTTSTDSNEFSWTSWTPEVTHNRWDPLPTPEPHPDDK